MAKYYVFLMDSRVVQISSWLIESEYNQPTVNECDDPIEGALVIEDPGPQSERLDNVSPEEAQKLLNAFVHESLPVTFNSQMQECLHNACNVKNFTPYEDYLKNKGGE